MKETKKKLAQLREKIDSIDSLIVKLLNQRAKTVLKIGQFKKEAQTEFYSPEREQEIYKKISLLNTGSFPVESLKAVYREIMSASLSLEAPLKIAYLGPEATFTHMAAIAKFGYSTTYVPVKSIRDTFTEVECDRADYGVVPIENSTEGVVNHTLDMFVESDLKICAEILLRISHHLMSPTVDVNNLKKVYSHPQSFAQCRDWIENNLPKVELIEVYSNAKAAQLAAKEPYSGAIAGEIAARLYNLKIIARNIEDNPDNYTRFLIIGEKSSPPTGNDRTSIMFSIKDRVGALYSILQPFQKCQINLTNIESRPSKIKLWDYYFFVDFKGHIEEENIQKALRELKKYCINLKILGSYPAGG